MALRKPKSLVTISEAAKLLGEDLVSTAARVKKRNWEVLGEVKNEYVFNREQVLRTELQVSRGNGAPPIPFHKLVSNTKLAASLLLHPSSLRTWHSTWGLRSYANASGRYYYLDKDVELWKKSYRGRRVLSRHARWRKRTKGNTSH